MGVAYGVLFGSAGPTAPSTVLWGAAAMLMAGAAVGSWNGDPVPLAREVAQAPSGRASATVAAMAVRSSLLPWPAPGWGPSPTG
jgi:hypothetical protein